MDVNMDDMHFCSSFFLQYFVQFDFTFLPLPHAIGENKRDQDDEPWSLFLLPKPKRVSRAAGANSAHA
jgi:hypothetical protein